MGIYREQYDNRFKECADVFENIRKYKTLATLKAGYHRFVKNNEKEIIILKDTNNKEYAKDIKDYGIEFVELINKELIKKYQTEIINWCSVLNVISMKKIKNLDELKKFYINENELIKNEMMTTYLELNPNDTESKFEEIYSLCYKPI